MERSRQPARLAPLYTQNSRLKARPQGVSPEIVKLLRDLRKRAVIGFVGGSDLVKITEQLAVHGSNSTFQLRTHTPKQKKLSDMNSLGGF